MGVRLTPIDYVSLTPNVSRLGFTNWNGPIQSELGSKLLAWEKIWIVSEVLSLYNLTKIIWRMQTPYGGKLLTYYGKKDKLYQIKIVVTPSDIC